MAKVKERTSTYNTVSIRKADYAEYQELARKMADELDFPVTVPKLIRRAVTFYKENVKS